MSNKPEYLFILEDKLGGVASFNRNLINYSSLRSQALVRLIWIRETDSAAEPFTDPIAADEVERFSYHSLENRFHVLRRLHTLMADRPGALICNDGLEMEAIYQYGTNKTVYQLVHDFYNVRLAVKFGAITDVFISHSKLFRDVLLSAAPALIKSFWIPQGIPLPPPVSHPRHDDPLRLVFTGRLTENKGVLDLLKIEDLLQQAGVTVTWTIIGKGELKTALATQWAGRKNILFAAPASGKEVLDLMSRQDVFVFPTRFEGAPVALHEALGVGLVPVISDLPGGISETVTEDIGRRIPIGNLAAFAAAITFLHRDRETLARLSDNASRLARERFDVQKAADAWFGLFSEYAMYKQSHDGLAPMPVGFRLDEPWMPNALVRFIRNLRPGR